VFDMTCEEIHSYIERHLYDAEFLCDNGVAEHIATCGACNRFAEEQRELGSNLRLIRESVGPIPESLDAAAVSNYRLYVSDQQTKSRATLVLRPAVLRWSAVAAAVLVAAAILFFESKRTVTTNIHPAGAQIVTRAAVAAGSAESSAVATGTQTRPKPVAKKQTRPSVQEERPVRLARSLPEGFRSLMYCDELSCPGDMDMIRVQLPSSAMPRQVSGFIQPVRSVTADVLVGRDGIARGIRFDEIEF
jgi:hypothetical protein